MGLDSIIPRNPAAPLPGTEPEPLDVRQVATLAEEAGVALQEVQRQLGRDDHDAAKVRFPRGYLIEIGRWRLALRFVRSNAVRNNVAYTLMMYDAQTWLVRRTDLAATARDMIVKAAISSLGSIIEALVVDATTPPMGRRQKMYSRIERLVADGGIPSELEPELKWLWDTRNRQHLQDLSGSEFDFYDIGMLPRAEAAFVSLVAALQRRAP